MSRHTFAILAMLLALPSAALAAETLGSTGFVTQLEVNTTSADTYLQYHGRAFIKATKGAAAEYRWGGTSCGTRTLSEAHVSMLQRALDSGLQVQPLYQVGQGNAACLVGFRMVP